MALVTFRAEQLKLKTSGGLKSDSGELALETNDFAGVGLEDDGGDPDKLRLASQGNGIAGGAGSTLSIATNSIVTFSGAAWTFGADELKVSTPTQATAVASKSYVDSVASGLAVHEPCRAGTAANPLDTELSAGSYVHGSNTAGTNNGVKIAVTDLDSGAWVIGDTITEATSGTTGTLRAIDSLTSGAATVMYISNLSAAYTGGLTLTGSGNSATATGGTITEMHFHHETAASSGIGTLDSVSLLADDRVLVKNETESVAQVETVICDTQANMNENGYFWVFTGHHGSNTNDDTAYYVWINKGTGADPTPTSPYTAYHSNTIAVEADISGDTSAIDVAGTIAGVLNALDDFSASNSASSTVTITHTQSEETIDTEDGSAVSGATTFAVTTEGRDPGYTNGIFSVGLVGSASLPWVLERAEDFDHTPSAEIHDGDFFFITEGTVNGSNGFVQTHTWITSGYHGTVGETGITFSQFSGAGDITAGLGLYKTGNTLSFDVSEATPGTIVSGDYLLYSDAAGAGSSSFESITLANFLAVIDGDGLLVSGATLTLDINGLANIGTTIGGSDLFAYYDATTDTQVEKITWTNLMGQITTTGTLTGSGVWNAVAITTAYGGTGLTSYTAGDLVYWASGTTFTKLGIGTANQLLQTNAGATAPEWVTLSVDLTADVTGTLPETNGGTGTATYTTGDVLYSDSSNSLAKLAAGSQYEVLVMGASIPEWSTLNLAQGGIAVTGTLAEGYGGTGQSTYTGGDILYSDGANSLAKLAKGTALQHLRMNAGATAPEWSTAPTSTLDALTDTDIDAAVAGDILMYNAAGEWSDAVINDSNSINFTATTTDSSEALTAIAIASSTASEEGIVVANGIGLDIKLLSDVAVATGDSIIFSDVSDNSSNYSRTLGAVITDLSLMIAGTAVLNDLSGVTISGPAKGDILTHDGSNFVDVPLWASSEGSAICYAEGAFATGTTATVTGIASGDIVTAVYINGQRIGHVTSNPTTATGANTITATDANTFVTGDEIIVEYIALT